MQRNHGMRPTAVLIWGSAAFCVVLMMAMGGSASAVSALTVLHSFPGSASDGNTPVGRLIGDSKGNLYSTTYVGRGTGCGGSGCGVVFKLTPPVRPATEWTEKVLHSFKGGGDGANPNAGLAANSAGNLYGTTSAGGAFRKGAVFKLSQAGRTIGSCTRSRAAETELILRACSLPMAIFSTAQQPMEVC